MASFVWVVCVALMGATSAYEPPAMPRIVEWQDELFEEIAPEAHKYPCPSFLKQKFLKVGVPKSKVEDAWQAYEKWLICEESHEPIRYVEMVQKLLKKKKEYETAKASTFTPKYKTKSKREKFEGFWMVVGVYLHRMLTQQKRFLTLDGDLAKKRDALRATLAELEKANYQPGGGAYGGLAPDGLFLRAEEFVMSADPTMSIEHWVHSLDDDHEVVWKADAKGSFDWRVEQTERTRAKAKQYKAYFFTKEPDAKAHVFRGQKLLDYGYDDASFLSYDDNNPQRAGFQKSRTHVGGYSISPKRGRKSRFSDRELWLAYQELRDILSYYD